MDSPVIQSKLALVVMGVAVMTSLWQPVCSHGRLWTPPARSTMWRRGFNTPRNYNDNELFCGGFQHQVSLGYKCGICGDPYDSNRPHEAGGRFATGAIAETYTQGQEVTLEVDLTANHKGWFEFKICPTIPTVAATQDCLDTYPLQMSDGSGTKFGVTGLGSVMLSIPVILPPNLICDFCVLQWHYHAGNNYGVDTDGTSCVGCGYQEEFYGCADIKILSNGSPAQTPPSTPAPSPAPSSPSPAPSSPSSDATVTNNPVTASSKPETAPPTTNHPRTSSSSSSSPTTPNINGNAPTIYSCWARLFIPGLDAWCNLNCNMNYCPDSHCQCVQITDPRASTDVNLPPGCYATSPFANWPGMDYWCWNNCPGGNCADNRCFCKS